MRQREAKRVLLVHLLRQSEDRRVLPVHLLRQSEDKRVLPVHLLQQREVKRVLVPLLRQSQVKRALLLHLLLERGIRRVLVVQLKMQPRLLLPPISSHGSTPATVSSWVHLILSSNLSRKFEKMCCKTRSLGTPPPAFNTFPGKTALVSHFRTY